MKTLNFIFIILGIGINAQQQIGIGTATPGATLDVVTAGSTVATKSLDVKTSSGSSILSAADSGFVGFGLSNPKAIVDVQGVDNNYTGAAPSFRFYNSGPQTLQYYLQPNTSLNPAALGSRALIFDNDNDPASYTGGIYIGTHTGGGYPMGISMGEKAGFRLSMKDSGGNFNSFLVNNPTYRPPAFMFGGDVAGAIILYNIAGGTDVAARTAALNGSCANPGKIVFTGSMFLGCVETAADPAVGTWKKLDN